MRIRDTIEQLQESEVGREKIYIWSSRLGLIKMDHRQLWGWSKHSGMNRATETRSSCHRNCTIGRMCSVVTSAWAPRLYNVMYILRLGCSVDELYNLVMMRNVMMMMMMMMLIIIIFE
jgi:hypothetical protein